MTIQETIIEALKTVQSAHTGALSTIAGLRSDKAALEAEIARLNAHIASLNARIAHLEAESVKIVEPDSVRSLLASLAHLVTEGQRAAVSGQAAARGEQGAYESAALERPRYEEGRERPFRTITNSAN